MYITTTITSLPFLLLSPFSGVSCSPGLSLRLASMPLATARAPLRMLTFPPPLAQLLFCRCRRALAVHLDYQYLAVIQRHPICCMNGSTCLPRPNTKCSIPSVEVTTRALPYKSDD